MVTCKNCGSSKVANNGGSYLTKAGTKTRHKCKDCGFSFTMLEGEAAISSNVFTLDSPRSIVVTSCNENSAYDQNFFATLKSYCDINQADLYILPVRHKNPQSVAIEGIPEELREYIVDSTVHVPAFNLKIFGNLKLSGSLENPLSGLDPLSKGVNLIVGHPQVQLRTLPRVHEKYPAILTTTGSISKKDYPDTKPGTKASFNHSYSALVLEFDIHKGEHLVHMRHLNYDEVRQGFWDLETYYSFDGTTETGRVKALITGDEHAIFSDPEVRQTTYGEQRTSLTSALQPEMIVRHDVLDAHSISHHHSKDFIKRYEKFVDGSCSVEKELELTVDYLLDTTPSNAESYIVQSNHNEHLYRWLNACDPEKEPWNAKIYHYFMYNILASIDIAKPQKDPFMLWCEDKLGDNIQFVGRNEKLEVMGILLGSHGDVGVNGAKGTREQFSKLPTKSVIGHSHSPGIEKGCYQVGTSSILQLEYNVGASSWHHSHCIVHKNGKRQLIFIQNGKFRK